MPALIFNSLLSALTAEPREIPVSFLYDDKGSEIYEEITKLEEYYPFNAEANLLTQHVASIASHIPKDSVIVELGCGTARKTIQILNAVVERHGSCQFAGIDVSSSFLEEARTNILKNVPGMKTSDITLVEAEYLQGLKLVREKFKNDNLCILWLGSSAGNLSSSEAVEFFKNVALSAGSQIQFLLCVDMWKEVSVLHAAYCDSKGVTERFIKNGVRNAFSSLGYAVSDKEEASWIYDCEVNDDLRRVEMWVRFPNGFHLDRHGIEIQAGERILMEFSRKFTVLDIETLATSSRFCVHAAWRDNKYGIQMLLPAEEALRQSWRDTDAFFCSISDWSKKPIDLRHPFCFYYGHVAAFAKLKMLPEEPATSMEVMFSRGIDPIVLDPSKCHSHPEAPPQWPPLPEIMNFVAGTRQKMMDAVSSGKVAMTVLNFSLEHDRMHHETLCYMLAQEQKTLFESSAAEKKAGLGSHPRQSAEPARVHIPAGEVSLGVPMDTEVFFWDNEGPPVTKTVERAFSVAAMPVTVAQFRKFLIEEKPYDNAELWSPEDFSFFESRGQKAPATWSLVHGEYFVSFPQETRHWTEVAEAPVYASLSEAEAFCKVKNGRVMTEAEYQRILDTKEGEGVQLMRSGGWEWTSSVLEPFPGFEPLPMYVEYSSDFFDGLHYVMKGSSPSTHPSMLRDSFRNFYQRQYPFVFAKFRVCWDS